MEHFWSVQLLGGFTAQRIGLDPFHLNYSKPNLLLARLAFDLNKEVARYELSEMLWPDGREQDGGHPLSVALNTLRKMLEPTGVEHGFVLSADSACVKLNSNAATTDLFQVQFMIAAARKAKSDEEHFRAMYRAVDLYSGELLPGAANYWALTARESVTTWYLGNLHNFINRLISAGRLDEALEQAVRAEALSPDDELFTEQVLTLLIRLHRAGEAGNHFVALCARLVSTKRGAPGEAIMRVMGPHKHLLPRPPHQEITRASHSPTAAVDYRNLQSAGIPAYLNGFFGRDEEIQEITDLFRVSQGIDLLAPGPARLVTITGLGGIGKTRLAAEAARLLAPMYGGHVLFLTLSGALRSEDVIQILAGALRLSGKERANVDSVAARFQGFPWLLVLDNCERVSGCGRFAKTLLHRCPLLGILTSSRAPLNVIGERVVGLEPLGVPVSNIGVNELAENPGARLFVNRAQSVRPKFRLSERNAETIADILAHLDGLPLAIELVAARARTLTPAQMLSEISQGSQNPRSAIPAVSNRKMIAHIVGWSYRHLSADARRFFAAISIFRGGFTLRAALEVTCSPNTIDLIDEIAAHSLIIPVESADAMRYRMLDCVMAFAADQVEPQDLGPLANRHSEYCLNALKSLMPELHGSNRRAALDELDDEHANILVAIERMQGRPNEVRLAAACWPYWYARAKASLGISLIERALTVDGRDLPEYQELLDAHAALLDLEGALHGTLSS